MIGFLVFLLFFALILVLFVLSSVIGIIRSVFSFLGFGRKTGRAQQQPYSQAFDESQHQRKNKMFDKDEGEYVDYEDVK